VEAAGVEGRPDDVALPTSLGDQLRAITARDEQPLASHGDTPLVALRIHRVDRVPADRHVVQVRAAARDAAVVQSEDALRFEGIERAADDALPLRTSPPGHLPLARRQSARQDQQQTDEDAEVPGSRGPLEERVEDGHDRHRHHYEQRQPLPPCYPPIVTDPLVLTLRGLARHPMPRSPSHPDRSQAGSGEPRGRIDGDEEQFAKGFRLG
jgi:hypothetical protein